MKAAVFHGPRDVRIETVPDPQIKAPTDAIVRIKRAAICGSDLHFYDGRDRMVPDFVLGHEGVGVVEEVGSGIFKLRKGQRVVVSAVVACGNCFFCRRGQVSQCSATGSAILGCGTNFGGALGMVGGEQAEAVCVPFADYTCYPLPEAIDDERAVFLADILPTGFFGALCGGIQPGDTVLVIGCGPVGLCATMSAALFGPAAIVAADGLAYRRELAAKFGAIAVDPSEAKSKLLDLTEGRGADVCIEAVGSIPALDAAFANVRGGGTVSMIGVTGAATYSYPMMSAFMKDVTVRGGLADIPRHIPALTRLVENKRLDPRPLISHVLALDEVPRGYEIFNARAEGALKVLIKP